MDLLAAYSKSFATHRARRFKLGALRQTRFKLRVKPSSVSKWSTRYNRTVLYVLWHRPHGALHTSTTSAALD